jgi:hypothetical protein
LCQADSKSAREGSNPSAPASSESEVLIGGPPPRKRLDVSALRGRSAALLLEDELAVERAPPGKRVAVKAVRGRTGVFLLEGPVQRGTTGFEPQGVRKGEASSA